MQKMVCNFTEFDFSVPKHVELLDEAVVAMFSGAREERQLAEKMLTALKDDAVSWTKVDKILESSTNQQTKYFALQILEQVITTRWRSLPRTQCEGIKKYIVGLIIKTSMVREVMEREKMFLNKLNLILIQVVKREWPKRWESFIPDIVGSSKKNESLCQNNMVILQLLSEEVFDFSAGKMTQTKIQHLKTTMCDQFQMIFELCIFVMENSQDAMLVEATLETFLKFLSWIPVGFIFETKIIDILIAKFLNVPLFRNVTLKCLTEIASLDTQDYGPVITSFFVAVMNLLLQMLPPDTNIAESYNNSTEPEQNFIQNLAMFLSIFLTNHQDIVLGNQLESYYVKALHYLLLLTSVEELEVFKICLEYWHTLCADLYMNKLKFELSKNRKYPFYAEILTELRPRIIGRMAKPKEVLVVENENGEVVREVLKDTDSVTLYKTMRETLVYLTHLDYVGMETVMVDALESIARGHNYSWQNLNTLCWAIGSVSGAMPEVGEKNFLVVVIRNLLTLCEEKRGKDNKAIIAANIMYVVGQYPRFLRSHWKFLKTVVNKLFEFMHETHDGVQDMACDTFYMIAKKCAKEFLTHQDNELRPMIHEIVECSSEIINDLQPHQVHCFYQAVGTILKVLNNCDTQLVLTNQLLRPQNLVWKEIIACASQDVDALKDQNVVKQLVALMKTNTKLCEAIGRGFSIQLDHNFVDMMNVYKVTMNNVNQAVAANGEAVTRQPLLRNMMALKKEIVRLMATWVESSKCGQQGDKYLAPFLEVVLVDYRQAPAPSARDPEVLRAMATVVRTLQSQILDTMPQIFDAIFECTLEMINKDMQEYPEFRTNFFLFIQAVNDSCFQAFMAITPKQFKLVLDSVIWAFKHTMREVADVGLEILMQLFTSIEKYPDAAQSFYQTYFTEILQHIFCVVTDSSQAAGMHMHAAILSRMFMLVETGAVAVPLSTGTNLPADNITYIQEFVAGLLRSAFPHLTDHQIKVVVQGLFNLDEDIRAFKAHLRDFLVQIREFTGEDDYDLYLDEREQQLQQVAAEKLRIRMSVPGILNPHEVMD